MADERIYTINLRNDILKAPIYKRTAKAVSSLREFVQHHMKNENVKIQPYLNMHLTSRGIKNPPTRIKVKVWKEKVKDIEIVKVELADAPQEKPVEAPKEIKKEEVKTETVQEKPLETEKKEVLMHEKHEHKESKKAKPSEVATKKPFDSEKTTKIAPHKGQTQKKETKK